ncbi:MAG: hypothetical protein HGA51_02120 [Demequinaceae bacterium]|nr:hypothetical protein [Demequinaceae bacterium]
MTVTAAEVAEYNRFGPWIDEITDPEDIPRLFRTYPVDLTATRMVLKVPRSIVRRDATAGMDLYDHLVILDQDSLTLLSRHIARGGGAAAELPDTDFRVLTLALADVVSLRDDLNLLDGRVTVSTSSGASIVVPYNGSAHDMATRLVNDLRAAACATPPGSIGVALRHVAGPRDAEAPNPGHADTHLVSRFLELRRDNPGLVTWASHGRRKLVPLQPGLRGVAARASHAISPMTLHGAAVVADANAMEVLGRRASLVRGRNTDYSSSRLVIPFGTLDRLDVSAHPVYADASMVTFGAGEWAADLAVPRDSEAERLLRASLPSSRA